MRDITPRKPLFLVGYPHVPRRSVGQNDPLLASALYLSNGRSSLLLISVDVLFVTPASVRICRGEITRATGIPPEHILISATHTHSGPVTASLLAWRDDSVVPPPDPEYMDQLHRGVLEAALAAVAHARPAELAVTTAQVEGVGGNRLDPAGPFDPEMGLLAIRSEGQLMALDLIYGMHPTVMHEDSLLVSADFPHFTRRHLAEAIPGLVTVYHTAPCGNLSPRHHVRTQTFAEAERLGRRLGTAVLAAVQALEDTAFQQEILLVARCVHAELVPNRFPTVEKATQTLSAAQQRFENLKQQGAAHGLLRTAECAVFGHEEVLTLARAQASGESVRWQEQYRTAEVQVFRIGDAFVVGLPGEQFVEFALEIKQSAPCRTFIISLANGELQGYIVTPEARKQGGYEAAFALFAPESGRRLVRSALRLVEELSP